MRLAAIRVLRQQVSAAAMLQRAGRPVPNDIGIPIYLQMRSSALCQTDISITNIDFAYDLQCPRLSTMQTKQPK